MTSSNVDVDDRPPVGGSGADEPPPRRRWTRALVWLFAIGAVAMWVYAFSGMADRDHPDTLSDPRFGQRAEEICAAALAEVESFTPASQAQSTADRADTVVGTTAVLADMVDDLEAVAPSGTEGDMVLEWVSDWRVYLGDRLAYADAVRTDPSAPFIVSTKDGTQTSKGIDNFAKVNNMASCRTPDDV